MLREIEYKASPGIATLFFLILVALASVAGLLSSISHALPIGGGGPALGPLPPRFLPGGVFSRHPRGGALDARGGSVAVPPEGDSGASGQGGHGGDRSAHLPPRVFAGDCPGDAPAPAGWRDHRRAVEDRRGRGRHGRARVADALGQG